MRRWIFALVALVAACGTRLELGAPEAIADEAEACACDELQRTLEAELVCGDEAWATYTIDRQAAVYDAVVPTLDGPAGFTRERGRILFGDGEIAIACPFIGATVAIYATVPASEVAHP